MQGFPLAFPLLASRFPISCRVHHLFSARSASWLSPVPSSFCATGRRLGELEKSFGRGLTILSQVTPTWLKALRESDLDSPEQ